MAKSLKISNLRFTFSFREDRAILLVCIGIALVFWTFHKLSKTYSTTCQLRLNYELMSPNSWREAPPEQIKVTFSGRGWDLLSIHLFSSLKPLHFLIESGSNEQITNATLSNQIVEQLGNSSLKIESISPENIELQLDQLTRKKVPVTLQGILRPASGFHFKDGVILSPDSVEITGPLTLIATVNDWETIEIQELGIKKDFEATLKLKHPDTESILLSDREVRVEAKVEKVTEKLVVVPVRAINTVDSIVLLPKYIKLFVNVGISDYEQLSANDFEAIVDLAQAKAPTAQNSLPIILAHIPENIKVINFTPRAVEYIIVRR